MNLITANYSNTKSSAWSKEMNFSATDNSEQITDSIADKERLERIKCVVVGDGGSGKTSLLTVYAKGEFPEVKVECNTSLKW